MLVFSQDNFLILEHKVSFRIVPYPSSELIYKNDHKETRLWLPDCHVSVARARPAVPLGLWSITSSLRGNLYVPRLHKFIKWFADNDVDHRN